MVTLQKYIFVALVIFFVGIGLLFAGVNRVPFRNNAHPDSSNQHGHTSWLAQPLPETISKQLILTLK